MKAPIPAYSHGFFGLHNITCTEPYTSYPPSGSFLTSTEEHNSKILSRFSLRYMARAASTRLSIIRSCLSRISRFNCVALSSRESWYSPRMLCDVSSRYCKGIGVDSGLGLFTDYFLSNQYFQKRRVLSTHGTHNQTDFEFCSAFRADARPRRNEDNAVAFTKADRVHVRLTEEMAKEIRDFADLDFRTFNDELRFFIATGLEQRRLGWEKRQGVEPCHQAPEVRRPVTTNVSTLGRAIPLRRRLNVERRLISARRVS